MSKNFSNNPTLLLPKAIIEVPDYDEISIGDLNAPGLITEVNFYSQLNSFAFNADISIEDVDNIILNKIIEQHGVKVTIIMYELPHEISDSKPVILNESTANKVFQKTFNVDSIAVKKYEITFPYKSIIKIKLIDTFEGLLLNKIVHFSNFNIDWDSKEMEPINTIHRILYKYEHDDSSSPTVINEKIFGVDLNSLKRRFVTDQSTPMERVILDYLYSLYDTRWIEYLGSQPELKIPQCLLAFTNQYYLDNDALLKRVPYLTSVNLLDNDARKPLFSVPYRKKNERISVYAKKDYNLCIEETSIDLRGSAAATLKDKILGAQFRKSTFDPRENTFIPDSKCLSEILPISQPTFPDIKSNQNPPYLGEGSDPKFKLIDYINENQFLEHPLGIKENKYYFSDGSQSLYEDISELFFRPLVYVSIPFSAWHSPGQEIDLRMITKMYNTLKPNKAEFFSMNKIVSGRWKIINSVTNFKKGKENPNAFGMMPIETVGLGRTRYFHGEEEKS